LWGFAATPRDLLLATPGKSIFPRPLFFARLPFRRALVLGCLGHRWFRRAVVEASLETLGKCIFPRPALWECLPSTWDEREPFVETLGTSIFPLPELLEALPSFREPRKERREGKNGLADDRPRLREART
jgi:hypothetical protein